MLCCTATLLMHGCCPETPTPSISELREVLLERVVGVVGQLLLTGQLRVGCEQEEEEASSANTSCCALPATMAVAGATSTSPPASGPAASAFA